MKTERKSVSSAHKLDGLGKLKERAPRSEHVHLHQDIGHIRRHTISHLEKLFSGDQVVGRQSPETLRGSQRSRRCPLEAEGL